MEKIIIKNAVGKIVTRLTIILITIIAIAISFVSYFNSEFNNTYQTRISYKNLETKFEINEWSHWLIYYDEVLTHSARNYAFTKNVKWKERYDTTLKDLYKLINVILSKSNEKDLELFKEFETVNNELALLETNSFEAIVNNNQLKATAILDSKKYDDLKHNYQHLIQKYLKIKTLNYKNSFNKYILSSTYINKLNKERTELVTNVFILIIIVFIIFTFLIILFVIRRIKKITQFVDQIIIGDDFTNFESRNNNDLDEYIESVIETIKTSRNANNNQHQQEMSIQIETLRNEFKRNLHDRLGVLVSATKLHFYFLKPEDQNTELVKHYNTCLKLLNQTYSEIKLLSSPKSQDFTQSKLIDRIQSIISFFKKLKNIEIICDYHLEDHLLSNEQKEAIELIVREAINNTISHSKASLIKLHLNHQKGKIHLSIKDNGIGFEMSLLERKNGISFMEKRTDQLNGLFEIQSKKGVGTEIKVEL